MMIPVQKMNDQDQIDSVYLVSEKYVGVGKNGKPFLALKISDKTGVIEARLWEKAEDVAKSFETGDLVKIKGMVQLFQGRKQLVIHRLEKNMDESVSFEDYLPRGSSNSDENFAQLVGLVKGMSNSHLKQLVLDTLEDSEIRSRFLKAPAAKTIHHAWVGGLLEHILSICRVMESLAICYPFMNKDLLLFGAIFHDIGKIYELDIGHGIQYSHKGRLLGHMLLGCELVEKKASRILGFPEDLKDVCKHIILSHHNTLEHGSPKRPKFIEAYVIAMIDDMDSKISSMKKFIDLEREQLVVSDGRPTSIQRWSRYNELYDRYFLLDDLKKDQV
ncbi:MAG: 3'-5' exoribonuclease YhaM family protein [Pseudobdellovibrionaceae bacterium]